MRLVCLFVLLLSAAITPAFAGDNCKSFEFKSVKTLSVQNLGRLSAPEIVGTIAIYRFDREDRPSLHGRRAEAFLLFRLGDLGEMPVAGILYADKLSKLRDQKNVDGATTVTFTTDEPSCRFTLSVQSNGRVVAGEHLIGRVQ